MATATLDDVYSGIEVPPDTNGNPPAAKHTVEEIKQAILKVLGNGHRQAEAITALRHRLWDRFRTLYSGQWMSDLTTDSPVANSIYHPLLGELIDFANASEIQQMIPDPAAMDFVSVAAEWPGLEDDAEKGQALLRQKLRVMKPEGANSFFERIWQFKQDMRVCGNAVGVVTHEVFGGDANGDNLIEGPVPTRISPRNWYPWSNMVDNAAQCAHTIYAPLTMTEARKANYFDADDLYEKIKPHQIPRVEFSQLDIASQQGGYYFGPSDVAWRRYVYFGPLQWQEIADELGEPDWTRQDVIEALGAVNEIDPARADQEWWAGEWISEGGGYLLVYHPFGMDLPAGCGPVFQIPFRKINDELIGYGVYDTNQCLERQYNELNRLLMRLVAFAGDPPIVECDDWLDEAWLAEHEAEDTFLEPGERIKLKGGVTLPAGRSPFELLDMKASQVMAIINSEMARLEELMRADVQTTSDYTGGSRVGTATQASNNLNRSLNMEGFHIKNSENGWMLDIVQRIYVLMRQVIQMRGAAVNAKSSEDEDELRNYEIDPSSLRRMEYFTISISGSSSNQNRVYQVQQMEQLFSLVLNACANPAIGAQIGADFREYIKAVLSLLEIKNMGKFFTKRDDLKAQMFNVTALIGQNGVESLPDDVQAQIAAMLQAIVAPGAGQPGQGAPAGATGQPALGTRDSTAGAGMGPSRGRYPGMGVGMGMSNMPGAKGATAESVSPTNGMMVG